MSVINGGDPVAHGFVDGFFECGLASGDGDDFCAHEPHASYVERLAFHVDCAHVNGAVHAEACADRGGGDAVLTCSCLSNDALFAEPLCEEDLPDGVVDFMSSGVEEVFAFEVDFSASKFFGPAFCEVEGGRATAVVLKEVVEFGLEGGVGFGLLIGDDEVVKWGYQCFRGKAAPELAKVSVCVWNYLCAHGAKLAEE